MKKFNKIVSLLVLVAFSMVFVTGFTFSAKTASSSSKTTINALFMKQAGYSEDDINAITASFQKANPTIKVAATFVPYEALEQKILTSASSGGFDVVLIDAPWTAKFAKAGIVKDMSDKLSAKDKADIFQGALDSGTYSGKLYGMPWLNDTKYLFYNKAMLKSAGIKAAPKTFDELLADAKILKAKKIVDYPIVWSWSQAEALICDYTAISSAFGAKMIDANGKPTFNTPENKKALDFMANSIKSGLTNPSSRESLEEDVRGIFSSGKAAFALNWTYMYNLAKDPKQSKVTKDVGITYIPGTGSIKSASVNGGMALSITSGSSNVDASWKYIQYLSSKDVQKKYAKNALPIWKSLYNDKEVIATNPDVVNASKVQYNYMVNRPMVPWYGELSTFMQVEIQQVLLGSKTSTAALNEIQKKATELSNK